MCVRISGWPFNKKQDQASKISTCSWLISIGMLFKFIYLFLTFIYIFWLPTLTFRNLSYTSFLYNAIEIICLCKVGEGGLKKIYKENQETTTYVIIDSAWKIRVMMLISRFSILGYVLAGNVHGMNLPLASPSPPFNRHSHGITIICKNIRCFVQVDVLSWAAL